MVSRCCSTDVEILLCETSYYSCVDCGLPCTLTEIKDEPSMGNNSTLEGLRLHSAT
jgi:hypothetical protein